MTPFSLGKCDPFFFPAAESVCPWRNLFICFFLSAFFAFADFSLLNPALSRFQRRWLFFWSEISAGPCFLVSRDLAVAYPSLALRFLGSLFFTLADDLVVLFDRFG